MKNHNTILGFDSIGDFLISVSGWKSKLVVGYISVIGALTSMITNYIYEDAKAVYLLAFMMLCDLMTAIYRAYKTKTFTSKRFPRVLLIMVAYVMLLSIGWHMAHQSVLFSWLPGALYTGMISTIFISIVENLVQSKIIKAEFAKQLLDRLKLKDIFKKNEEAKK
jgi:peptidoglycan/LPS O-acetylase OafA/YrhL